MTGRPSVLVIGLDGVPFALVEQWAEQGDLPNLGRLMAGGVVGGLQSTVPPTSGPAWSSFQTGKNPGKTGVFDFLYRRPGSYTFAPASAAVRAGPTLWQLVTQAGRRVGVMNMPMTYPTEPLPAGSYIISGFMTPYTARDIGPPELLAELERQVGPYRIYPAVTYSPGGQDRFLKVCHQLLELRTQWALYLMRHHPVDLMAVVYFDPDRVLHQLWHLLDPGHPWRDDQQDHSAPVRAYFRHLDAAIGRLVEAAGDDALVILLSDHGMGPAHRFIVLNNWLRQAGLLRLRHNSRTRLRASLFRRGLHLRNVHRAIWKLGLARHAEYTFGYFAERFVSRAFLSFLDVDWSQSVAYSFGRHLGAIYLNVRGREPGGIVAPGQEYERVREQIIQWSRELVDPASGRPLVGRIARREEVYCGSYLDQAPDLILFPAAETDIFFGLSDFGSNHLVDTVYRYSGMHRDEGLLIMTGKGIRPGVRVHGAAITDLTPTILYALGQPVPGDMDGRVLESAFIRGIRPGSILAAPGEDRRLQPGDATGYSRSQEAEVVQQLRDLGYLG